MNRFFIVTIFFVFSAVSQAQDGKRESVEELLRIMNAESMIDNIYAQMDQMIVGMSQQMGIKPSEQELFDAYMKDIFASMRQDMSWEKMKDPMVDIYLKHYTEREIQDFLAFYRTESGRSMIEKMPIVLGDSLKMSQDMVQSFLPKVQVMAQDFQEKLRVHRASQ